MFFVKCFNVDTSEQLNGDLHFPTLEEAEDFIHINEEMVFSRFDSELKVFLDYIYESHVPMITNGVKGYHLYFRIEQSPIEVEIIE
ncbi:MAG: hypothetical protein ACQEUT_16140 [Bacillota bacterium]